MRSLYSVWWGETSAQRPKKFSYFVRQQLRLLERGEVSAFGHLRPAPYVPIHLLRQRARRAQDFLGKLGATHRHLDDRALGDRPRPVHVPVVLPEPRSDSNRHPAEHDLGPN